MPPLLELLACQVTVLMGQASRRPAVCCWERERGCRTLELVAPVLVHGLCMLRFVLVTNAWQGALVLAMIGVSYASVPLYRMFCQVSTLGLCHTRVPHRSGPRGLLPAWPTAVVSSRSSTAPCTSHDVDAVCR
jgi:hypothetical protein